MASTFILGRRGRAHVRRIGFGAGTSENPGDLITYSGDGHLMTFAPTGTGKTSGPVITNALTHEGQLIVMDIKGEIYAATAGARRTMGQEVHVLDMRDEDPLPGSLNPLDLVMLSGTDYAAMARGLATDIVECTGQERETFWENWAETMITGGVAWLLADKAPEERRFSILFDLLMGDDPTYNMAVMCDKGEFRHRAAKAAVQSYLGLSSDQTRPSVLGSTQVHLRFFDSETVRRLTDTSSMDVKALVEGKPMSLYIIIPPWRINAFKPLLRMWLSCLIFAITQRKNVPPERTLMLIDEVGNLGKIDALLTTATLMRSWGLTLWTFWQNVAQLQIYKTQANTLIDNAGVIQVFGARNMRMAQDLANIIGGVSADQIMGMAADEQMLLIEGRQIRCKQVRHYNDELFRQKEPAAENRLALSRGVAGACRG